MSQQQVIEPTKMADGKEVTLSDRCLSVHGKRFHYIWLRDNWNSILKRV